MDNYHGRTRTNFFKVNNINKFSNFMASVIAEELRITIQNSRVCFTCFGEIQGYNGIHFDDTPDEYHDMEGFLNELQQFLPKDEIIVIMHIGSDGFQNMNGYCCVITKEKNDYTDLFNAAVYMARELSGNQDFCFVY